MGRGITFLYGVVCYGIFFLTFLYLIGFLGDFNQIVPRKLIGFGRLGMFFRHRHETLFQVKEEHISHLEKPLL